MIVFFLMFHTARDEDGEKKKSETKVVKNLALIRTFSRWKRESMYGGYRERRPSDRL